MPLHEDMSAFLQTLSAQNESEPDLAGSLEELLALAVRAVPRCLGLTLTIDRAGLPVTFTARTVLAGLDPVLGSLSIQLPNKASPGTASGGPRLVFFSGVPGVFERLRADLLILLDLDPRRAVIDAAAPALLSDVVGQLDDLAAVDRALGVLLDRGYLIEEGRSELDRRAAEAGLTVPDVARLLIDSVADGAPLEDDRP